MDIAQQRQFPFGLSGLDQHLGMVDGRMCLFAGLDILTIEIGSRQVAPVVANYDSVDVEHGYNFKHKIISQTSGQTAIAK
jgi:hypothetical protein